MKAAKVHLRNSLVSQPRQQHGGRGREKEGEGERERERQSAQQGSSGVQFPEQDHTQCFRR